MTLPVYATGTVSVSNGGTIVTGVGGMWSGINAKQGDFFVRPDGTAVITEVTDANHLVITPWPGATVSGGTYQIQQNYVGRVVGVAAAEDVADMLEKLHVDGLPFILGADETVPDPSYGDEGQLAFKPSTGQWWVKSGGAWIPSAGLTALGYGGTSSTSVSIGISPPAKVFTTQQSLAYNGARVRAASAANLNNWMEGVATYSGTTLTMQADLTGNSGTYSDWLFSIAGTKGQTGATGPAGPQGIAGPPGATGSGSGNVTGPASAVNDRIAVYNGTSGTIIKDGGKTIAELGAGTIIVADTPPAGSPDGTLWWESDTGNLYIRYNDGDSTQWVLAVPATSAAMLSAVTYVAQTLTAAQQTVARQNIYAAPFDALAYSGMQVNGSIEVSQELGPAGSVTLPAGGPTDKYLIDGWRVQSAGPQVLSCAQATYTPAGFANSIQFYATTANAAPVAADVVIAYHKIEGYRVARLGWGAAGAQPITIGFWISVSTPGTYSGAINNGAFNRSYPFSFTVLSAGGFEFKTITIPGDTAGTWTKDNSAGLVLIIALLAGSSKTAAADVWGAGGAVGVTGSANTFAVVGNQAFITGVIVLSGIEAPSAARSPLIMRPYDQELLMCMRYYEKLTTVFNTTLYTPSFWKVVKCYAPTLTIAGVESGTGASFAVLRGSFLPNVTDTYGIYQGTAHSVVANGVVIGNARL